MADKDKLVEVNATLDRLAKLVEDNARQRLEDRAEANRQIAEANRQIAEAKRQLIEDRTEWKRQRDEDRAEWKRQRDEDRAKDRAEANRRQEEERVTTERRREETERSRKEAERRSEEAERSRKEAERSRKEAERRSEEADRRSEEADRRSEEADRRQAELNVMAKEMMAGINALRQQYQEEGDRWGKVAESLLAGELADIMLNRFGIALKRIERNISFHDEVEPCEIDAVGVNGDLVTAVEVKTTLTKSDTNAFKFKILDRLINLMPEHRGKKVYGGVAYIKVGNKESESAVIKHAEGHGLFVIKIIGDSNKLVNSKDFVPHDFHPQPTKT